MALQVGLGFQGSGVKSCMARKRRTTPAEGQPSVVRLTRDYIKQALGKEHTEWPRQGIHGDDSGDKKLRIPGLAIQKLLKRSQVWLVLGTLNNRVLAELHSAAKRNGIAGGARPLSAGLSA